MCWNRSVSWSWSWNGRITKISSNIRDHVIVHWERTFNARRVIRAVVSNKVKYIQSTMIRKIYLWVKNAREWRAASWIRIVTIVEILVIPYPRLCS
jgi:hypothetical protein